MSDLKADPRYEEARRHAHDIRGFYTHLAVYLLVNAGLAALNAMTNPGRLWFGWATFGWGIGLIAHGVSVFACAGWFGADWEERKIRQYLERRP